MCNEGCHQAEEGEACVTNSTETDAFGGQVGIGRGGPEKDSMMEQGQGLAKPAYWPV